MGIVAQNIMKDFGKPPTRVLHDINLSIQDGEMVSITGRSGSGKSTLLYLLSSLDYPTQGTILLDGKNIAKISSEELHRFRNRYIGFIFQFHYLLPELTAIENVLLPARNLGLHHEKKNEALQRLAAFELESKTNRFPSELSGGEQQRVAIARALIMHPRYIFADEPTGNLDTVNGQIVMNVLREENQKHQTTIVLVTHEPEYAMMADRQISLHDGRIDTRSQLPAQIDGALS